MKSIKLHGKEVQTLSENSILNHIQRDAASKPFKSYALSLERSEGNAETIAVEDYQFSEVEFEDGTVWYGLTEDIPKTFLSFKHKDRDTSDDVYVIPPYLGVPDDRSLFSWLKTKFVTVFSLINVQDLSIKAEELALRIDRNRVQNEGLSRFDASFTPSPFDKSSIDKKPYLLFLHGTISSTAASFAGLNNIDVFKDYEGRILGFDHYTLSKSPLQNAVELFEQLPKEIEVHIISQSRGGLIGDILSRFQDSGPGYTKDDIKILVNNREDDSASKRDQGHMEQLNKLARDKNLIISKFLRVACPAQGTRLLTENTDFVLNVLFNLLRKAVGPASPIISGISHLVLNLIKKKSKPNIFPGLEAMIPESPFQRVNNRLDVSLNQDIHIIYSSANIRGGFLKSLGYMLSQTVFRQKNDFVVDSSSMLYGTLRDPKRTYFYKASGDDIYHLSYFNNSEVQAELTAILRSSEDHSFEKDVPASDRGVLGAPGGKIYNDDIDQSKESILLLPGILGSVLCDSGRTENKDPGNPYWLNYLRFPFAGINPMQNNKLSAAYLMGSAYEDLVKYLLKNNYNVITIPYDWRASISELGIFLEREIRKILDTSDKSVKVIAHSMGGLLMKDLMVHHNDTYRELASRINYKFLMLGTPWKGAHALVQELIGEGPRIKSIDKLALFQNKKTIMKVFRTYKGALNLLPLEDEIYDYTMHNLWVGLSPKTGWPLPRKADLVELKTYFDSVKDFDFDFTDIIYLAGQADETIYQHRVRGGRVRFPISKEGDGSVTWASIPEELHQNTYYCEVSHGELANEKSIFPAILELIQKGSSQNSLLSRIKPIRDRSRSEDSIQFATSPMIPNNKSALESLLLGGSSRSRLRESEIDTITVRMQCADLRKARYPILIGHQRGLNLMGAEKAANRYLNNDLQHILNQGLYPQEIGTSYHNIKVDSSFRGCIIIGCGPNEKITGQTTEESVEKGIKKYIIDMFNNQGAYEKSDRFYADSNRKNLGVSALLISSYYGKLSVATSIQSVLKGINKANKELHEERKEYPKVTECEFVEIYLDKCRNAFTKLIDAKEILKNEINIQVEGSIKLGEGYRLQLPFDHDKGWWQRFTVSEKESQISALREFRFAASTINAIEENFNKSINHNLLNTLLKGVPSINKDKELSKTLYELLIPNEIKDIIRRRTNALWIVDKNTASIPWEMMETDLDSEKPLCTQSGMIRQFASTDFTKAINRVTHESALIIGNPDTEGAFASLSGAEQEAKSVKNLLSKQVKDIVFLDDKDLPSTIIKKLMTKPFRYIHIAAHGIFKDDISRIVIGKDDYLLPSDFKSLSYTPDIVFINCCHIGNIDLKRENLIKNRYKFAASIGVQLMEKGVRAVVVAGWAVNDGAAQTFAETFYRQMLEGKSFGDAITIARNKTFEKHPNTNTWGAYQCYGSPDFRLSSSNKNKGSESSFSMPFEAEIKLKEIKNSLSSPSRNDNEIVDKLDLVSKKLERSNFTTPTKLLEMRAECYKELLDWDQSINIFRHILSLNNSEFSFKSLEVLYNLEVRRAFRKAFEKKNQNEDIKNDKEALLKGKNSLVGLSNIFNTSERLSLIGSAYHRLSILEPSDSSHLEQMRSYYYDALQIALKDGIPSDNYYHYPLCMYLKVDEFTDTADASKKHQLAEFFNQNDFDELLTYLIRDLEQKANNESFWDEIALVNMFNLMLLRADNEEERNLYYNNSKIHYKKAWSIGGTFGERQSDLTHLTFLITHLQYAESKIKKKSKKEDIRSAYRNAHLLEPYFKQLINFIESL